MKLPSPYRIASVLFAVFCAMHTAGGMFPRKSQGLAADAVFASMRAVTFNFGGATCSWYGFWFGFGITVSVYLLFSSFVAWQLDKVPASSWPAISAIAWAFAVSQAAAAALTWAYFFPGAAILSSLLAALLFAGAWRKGRGLASA